MRVDFSEMNPQVPSPLNSGRSGGIAAARVAFKALTSPDLDVNEGCFRPLEVVLPEGTMVSARPGAALGRWSIALPTVIDTILRALSSAVPQLVPAAHKGDMGGCSFFGFRPDGSRYLLMNIFGGGWGGRPNEDGESAAVSVCQGDVRNTPVELQEIKYPVLIDKHAFRADSGGAGRFRGGLGLEVAYRMLQSCRANINCERTVDPPWGVHGGHAAATNSAIVHRAADGYDTVVLKATELPLDAGDVVTFFTAGGGGYGDPGKRARDLVAQDVAEGVVTKYAAQKEYGAQMAGPRV
jgi:N-methylhydantoinase B